MELAPNTVDCLMRGVSVELVGRPMSGRSTVLAETAKALDSQHWRAVAVRGVLALRDRPLAALHVALPALGRAAALRESVDCLSAELAGQSVLIVDDVDDLDDVSLGVVVSVLAATPTPVLVSRRLGMRPEAPLRDLLSRAQPSIRCSLGPLSFDDLRAVVEPDLAAPVDTPTMARIATLSGGLPGVARALVVAGRISGHIFLSDGVWTSKPPPWSAHSGPAIEALLVDATAEDVDALTVLAVAGPCSVEAAGALVSGQRIERLSDLGLVEVVDGADEGAIGVYPPSVGEHLVQGLSAARRDAIRTRLAAHRHAATGALDAARLSAASPVGDAILSRSVSDTNLKDARERLSAWEKDPTATAAVPLLMVLPMLETPIADPRDVYARTDGSGCSDLDNIRVAVWYAFYLGTVENGLDEARSVLDTLVRRIPSAKPVAVAMHARLALLHGPLQADYHQDLSSLDPYSKATSQCVSAEIDLALGAAERALAGLESFDPPATVTHHHADILRGLALLMKGEIEVGYVWAAKHLREARAERNLRTLQGFGYLTALAAAIKGDFGRLDSTVSLIMTLTALPAIDMPFYRGVAGLTCARSRWLLDPDLDALVYQPRGNALMFGPFPFMSVPGRAGGSPRDVSQRDVLWEDARTALDRGYLAAAAFNIVEAAEHGRPTTEPVERFTDALSGLRSPLLIALTRFAQAILARSTSGLAQVEEAFAELGAWTYACRAGIHHALALRESGDYAGSTEQTLGVWNRVVPHAPDLRAMFVTMRAAVDLTPREVQIARYAVAGRATVDIATDLVLSARTVEYHLSRIYRKIGVDSRQGLRIAFQTWLDPAGHAGHAIQRPSD